MSMYSPEEISSEFKEISQFTGHISKLFVQEVRKRASNQSTGEFFVRNICFSVKTVVRVGNEFSVFLELKSVRNLLIEIVI